MNKKKLFITTLATVAAIAAFVPQASGAGNTTQGYGTTPYGAVPCTNPYGNNTNCPTVTFSIDKLVQTPSSSTKGGQNIGGNYVDNLGVLDPKYTPSSTVNFKIKVTNTGNTKISKLEVTDVFPEYLSFTTGVGGAYDQKTRTLKYTINNLEAGKTSEVVATAKIADVNALPSDKGVVCVENRVTAQNMDNGQTQADTSSVCIEKNAVGGMPTPQVFEAPKVKQTPPTGPEMAVLPVLGSLGALGAFIRRKAKA